MKEEKKVAENAVYKYKNEDGKDMVEFNVNDCSKLLNHLSRLPFQGMLSARKAPEDKPIICFGHDECIFKQFALSPKCWKRPNGEIAPVPKDEGAGLMISAFQSCEFGFGMQLSPEELQKVNEY